jgi:hypothetical protein
MAQHPAPTREVRTLPALNVTLTGQICAACNNGTLSRIEGAVVDILRPMIVRHEKTTLTVESQKRLATWAVKTVYLLEPAVRQSFPGRPIDGFLASESERAWLFTRQEPPPRSRVWLACWDAESASALMYEPSGAPIPTRSGPPLQGQLTTFALGFVAFQVFSVDFVAAESEDAVQFHPPQPSPAIASAINLIWPSTRSVAWPGPAIAHDEWNRLVTWEGALRGSV